MRSSGAPPRRPPRRTAGLAAVAAATLALLPPLLHGQEAAAGWPEPAPADVTSIDAIIGALYDVISGPAGEKRDWDRFRSLHLPEARLIPTGRRRAGDFVHFVWSVDDYIERAGAQLEQAGFFEREVARVTEEFGSVAHAFSTYESRRSADDPEPFQRGVNSIQLMNDGERWWIVNILWRGESPGLTIPPRYLPGDASRSSAAARGPPRVADRPHHERPVAGVRRSGRPRGR